MTATSPSTRPTAEDLATAAIAAYEKSAALPALWAAVQQALDTCAETAIAEALARLPEAPWRLLRRTLRSAAVELALPSEAAALYALPFTLSVEAKDDLELPGAMGEAATPMLDAILRGRPGTIFPYLLSRQRLLELGWCGCYQLLQALATGEGTLPTVEARALSAGERLHDVFFVLVACPLSSLEGEQPPPMPEDEQFSQALEQLLWWPHCTWLARLLPPALAPDALVTGSNVLALDQLTELVKSGTASSEVYCCTAADGKALRVGCAALTEDDGWQEWRLDAALARTSVLVPFVNRVLAGCEVRFVTRPDYQAVQLRAEMPFGSDEA